MKKRSNLLKFILVSACCISTVFSQSAFTGQAAEIQEESYESSDESEESDEEVITPHYSEESKGKVTSIPPKKSGFRKDWNRRLSRRGA
ncbi:MAG: hypothetical protein V8S08_02310 [Lachnoclostridium sp.]